MHLHARQEAVREPESHLGSPLPILGHPAPLRGPRGVFARWGPASASLGVRSKRHIYLRRAVGFWVIRVRDGPHGDSGMPTDLDHPRSILERIDP